MAWLLSSSFTYAGRFPRQPEFTLKQTDKKITGRVLSNDDNMPVPRVTVLVKNTTTGTTTGVDGKYEINVAGNNSILVFSAVGFLSQEKSVGTQSAIDIVISSDQKALDEVVVVGYGTLKNVILPVLFHRSTLPNSKMKIPNLFRTSFVEMCRE